MIGEMTTRQIVALANDGAGVDEIATTLNIEVPLVKLALEGNNVDKSSAPDRDITDDDLKLLRRHAMNLALSAENEAVQARMTMYLIDRDKPKVAEQTASPITLINNALITANKSMEALKAEYATNS